MPIALLLQGAALGLTAAASPGPFQAYLISQTLAGGWRRGAVVAFAPLISDVPIVAAALLLLSRVPAGWLRGVYFVGSLFVLWLAWDLWRAWRTGGQAAAPGGQARGGVWRGVLMNILSPGPYTFWTLVSGPILLAALRESPWLGAAFLLGFYGLLVGGNLALAGVFHQARRLGPRVVRGMVLASIIILALFAGVLLYQGIIFQG